MANSIEVVVAKQAIDGLEELYKNLDKSHKKIIEISKTQIDFAGGSSVKGLSDFNAKMKEAVKLNSDLAKENEKLVNALAKLEAGQKKVSASAKQLEQASIKESNARNSLNKQREVALAQLDKEQQKLNASENLYNKLQAKLNVFSNEYKNLATRKELGLTLTAKEEQRYTSLQGRIQNYDKTLKAVDGTMGKYQRNVGNYASGFNALNNSINQLGREAPAFANSWQTGFMAISNNLPSFFDAMGDIIAQNKELQKQGEPTKSVFSQLASGLFSVQTLLSVGVTLLTVYGAEIVEWATGLTTAEKSLKRVNQAQIEVQSQSLAQGKDLDKYRDVVNNTNLSEKERLRALKLLKEQIPELSKVELNHANALQQVNKYTDYYIKQAAIRYRSDQFIKKAGEELIKQQEIRSKIKSGDLGTGFVDYLKGFGEAMVTNNLAATSTFAYVNSLKRLNEELKVSKLDQKKYEKSAEIEIRQRDITNEKISTKVSILQREKDLTFDLVDVYASMFELNKLHLEREIKMHEELANSEHETLEDRISNFSKYTDKKLELEKLQNNESIRLNTLEYENEVESLTNKYIEYAKQDNVTKAQRISARKELDSALKALSEKNNIDLQILELKHSDNIVTINAETIEKLIKLRELYGGLEFNKKIKEQELKDLLEHKNRLYNIDKNTTKKQLEDIGKDKKDSERKIQEQTLQNDISVINKKLENEDLGAEAEIRLKTELYEKLKALNNLELTVLEEKKKAQEDYLKFLDNTWKGFIDDFTQNSGFSKLFELIENFDTLKESGTATALAISEAFQEAFNTISEASQGNFDREYERLEIQKEVALQFAGDSATAKEEIERQAEEKRKAIARREAEAQKRLAIFNIAVDTAQAIVAAVAKSPETFGLPFSAVAAAIGAAQIAIVASQQIPQFWKGTDNAPEGFAWTQEKGAEIITDKNGKVKSLGNDKGAQLTYLNKGDKVLNAEKSRDYINKTLINAGIQPMRGLVNDFQQNNSLTTTDFYNGISKLAKTMQNNKGNNTQVFLNNKRIDTDYFKGKAV